MTWQAVGAEIDADRPEDGGGSLATSGGSPATGRRPWWTSGGFGRLFLGQAVSVVGSQVTFLALPIAAVFLLHASPAAMGLLGALDNLPYLLFGLGVGVLVDRYRRRRLMVSADLVRALAVGSIPISALAGRLTLTQLCVVVFIVGAANIVFDVSAQAQLPDLVAADRLVGANGLLQTTSSLSLVVGPGLAGEIIALLGAPVAILVDSVSYLVSALCIGAIREPEAPRQAAGESMRRQVAEGLRLVRADRRLIAIAGATSTASLAANAMFAVFVYFLVTRFGLGGAAIGFLYMAVGISGAAGAVLVPAAARRVGSGYMLAIMLVVAGVGLLGVALAGQSGFGGPACAAAVVGGSLLFGLGLISFSVLSAGLRQALAPAAARGRVLGTLRFFEWGSMPIGSLIGGLLGEIYGPVAAIEFAGLALIGASVWIVRSPLVGRDGS